MNKTFFKRRTKPKVFFDRNMAIRSFAYGEDVKAKFLEWQRYYNASRGVSAEKLVISSQKSIYGTGESGPKTVVGAALPPLVFDAMRFTAQADGWVYVNGNRTALNLGTELKAWAILTVAEQEMKRSMLCVIGKPNEATEPKLSLYPISKRGPAEQAEMSVPMEHTLSAESFIICLGRHIFTVHNARLDYRYCNFERGELEPVAIGADAPNAEAAWCQFVEPCVVTNTAGAVFWIAGDEIFGIEIGRPRTLIHIDGNNREKTEGISCTGEALLVTRKSKNTSQTACYRYQRAYGGAYTAVPLASKPSSGMPFGRR